MEVHYTCTHEDGTVKPTECCLKVGRIMERVNLFKVHCKNVRNYHNEISLCY
jgi:hypothetical protein